MKIHTQTYAQRPPHHLFRCPGCDCVHVFDSRWSFNGDVEKPTFRPSLLNTSNTVNPKHRRCHLFLVDGQIQFQPDCTHDLAGQTVECPEW